MCQTHEKDPSDRWTGLHRLREVRVEKRVSLEFLASSLGRPVASLAAEEDPTSDIPLSALREWSDALDVPVVRLLLEPQSSISLPGLTLDRLSHLEALVQQITEKSTDNAALTFAKRLTRQLHELRPKSVEIVPLDNGHTTEAEDCPFTS